ncbi:MAG: hypothetical protein OSB00_06605 [Sphingomonas bacterium]|nr:hypothetical protein [Sphingomonas bacterium]
MKITTREQLEQIRNHCKKLVTKRALTAGAASAVPYAVTGIAADVGILLELLPKINRAFGLDPDQIDALDEQVKQQIFVLAGSVGSQVIGRAVTKEVVLAALKAVGVRTSVKAAASYVPFIGSAVGGALGFAMMKFVGNQHVEECYQLISEILNTEVPSRTPA